MKLTEDDFIPIDSMGDTLIGFEEEYGSKEARQLRQKILDDQEKANQWDRFNSAFRNPIDWKIIELMSIKEVGKEPQTARMG